MVSRGVNQLKNMRLYFCDFGGSSTGVRDFLKSDAIKTFVESNPHLKLEIYLKRGYHPYMSSTYINGYVKDQPLRNMEEEQVYKEFLKFNSAFGRQALLHNSIKVMSAKKSIQGEWKDNFWGEYPKHELEQQRTIPETTVYPYPNNELKPKKIRPHVHTNFLRKKFPLPKYNNL